MTGIVVTDIVRADRDVVDALAGFGSATVHEALGRIGYAGPRIRPIQEGAAIAGSAVTVQTAPGDN
nr:4-carboxy-4-hydroxy-2-oxoadipate aldolase/oxaloacetate decarboxylase [Actinomycetota bacterium]